MTFYTESVGDQTNHFAYAFVLENFAYGYSVHEYFPAVMNFTRPNNILQDRKK